MERSLYIFVLAGLLIGCSVPTSETPRSAEGWPFQRSASCYAYYDLESCDGAVAAANGNPQALTLALADRSAAFSKIGNNDLAEADCQGMLALNVDLGRTATACGYVALFAGRYDEAVKRFDRAGSKSEELGARLFGRGIAHYASGETRLAAEDFEKAIQQKPKRPDYQLWRYLTWAELGFPDRTVLDLHEEAYDWEISSTANPMIDFQLGRGDEAYAWEHLDLFDDNRGLTQATLRCFFEFNLAHKAMVAGELEDALKHRDAGATVCTPGELSFHAFKGLSQALNARITEL